MRKAGLLRMPWHFEQKRFDKCLQLTRLLLAPVKETSERAGPFAASGPQSGLQPRRKTPISRQRSSPSLRPQQHDSLQESFCLGARVARHEDSQGSLALRRRSLAGSGFPLSVSVAGAASVRLSCLRRRQMFDQFTMRSGCRAARLLAVAVTSFVAVVLVTSLPVCADVTWTLSASNVGDWSVASNWGGTLPTGSDNAYINSSGTVDGHSVR